MDLIEFSDVNKQQQQQKETQQEQSDEKQQINLIANKTTKVIVDDTVELLKKEIVKVDEEILVDESDDINNKTDNNSINAIDECTKLNNDQDIKKVCSAEFEFDNTETKNNDMHEVQLSEEEDDHLTPLIMDNHTIGHKELYNNTDILCCNNINKLNINNNNNNNNNNIENNNNNIDNIKSIKNCMMIESEPNQISSLSSSTSASSCSASVSPPPPPSSPISPLSMILNKNREFVLKRPVDDQCSADDDATITAYDNTQLHQTYQRRNSSESTTAPSSANGDSEDACITSSDENARDSGIDVHLKNELNKKLNAIEHHQYIGNGNDNDNAVINSGISVGLDTEADDQENQMPIEIPDDEMSEKIVQQVEFYFSNDNILKDAFLLKHVRRNKEGFVSLKLISSFKRVRQLTKDWRVVGYAIKIKSKAIELNDLGSKVRRLDPLPVFDETMPSRTVVATDLPWEKCTIEKVSDLFSKFGEIALIRILRPGASIPADVRQFINKYPELQQKECALVEFTESQSARTAQTLHGTHLTTTTATTENNGNYEIGGMQIFEMVAPKKKTGKKATVAKLIENYKYQHFNDVERARGGVTTAGDDYKLRVRRNSSGYYQKPDSPINHQLINNPRKFSFSNNNNNNINNTINTMNNLNNPNNTMNNINNMNHMNIISNNIQNNENYDHFSNLRRISNCSTNTSSDGSRKCSTCSDSYGTTCSELSSASSSSLPGSRRQSQCSNGDLSISRRTSNCSINNDLQFRRLSICANELCSCMNNGGRRTSQGTDIYRRISQCSDNSNNNGNRRYSNGSLLNFDRRLSNQSNSDLLMRRISFDSEYDRKLSIGSVTTTNNTGTPPTIAASPIYDNDFYHNNHYHHQYQQLQQQTSHIPSPLQHQSNNNHHHHHHQHINNSHQHYNHQVQQSQQQIPQQTNIQPIPQHRKISSAGFEQIRKYSNASSTAADQYFNGRKISTDSGFQDRKMSISSMGSDTFGGTSPRSRSGSLIMGNHNNTNYNNNNNNNNNGTGANNKIENLVRTPIGPDGSKGFNARSRKIGQVIAPV